MPKEVSEKNKKAYEIINSMFKNNSKEFSIIDFKIELGKKEVWIVDSIIRKYLVKLEREGIIIHRKEGKAFIYKSKPVEIDEPKSNYDDIEEVDACIKKMTTDIQNISIIISSINGKIKDLSYGIVKDLSNAIGTQITNKVKEELGEFFQDFVKDFEILKEEHKKRHNQLGAIINLLNGIESKVNGFKAKQRVLDGIKKGKPF